MQLSYSLVASCSVSLCSVRRDKTLNKWSIMVRKRLRKEDDAEGDDEEVETTKKKSGKKDKSLVCVASVLCSLFLASHIVVRRNLG